MAPASRSTDTERATDARRANVGGRSAAERAWARYAGLGLQFAATVGAFVALGLWADRRLGTQPWLLLLGSALGFAGALLALVRAVPPARASAHPTQPNSPPPPVTPKAP